jgi:hypothetical protein
MPLVRLESKKEYNVYIKDIEILVKLQDRKEYVIYLKPEQD